MRAQPLGQPLARCNAQRLPRPKSRIRKWSTPGLEFQSPDTSFQHSDLFFSFQNIPDCPVKIICSLLLSVAKGTSENDILPDYTKHDLQWPAQMFHSQWATRRSWFRCVPSLPCSGSRSHSSDQRPSSLERSEQTSAFRCGVVKNERLLLWNNQMHWSSSFSREDENTWEWAHCDHQFWSVQLDTGTKTRHTSSHLKELISEFDSRTHSQSAWKMLQVAGLDLLHRLKIL